MTAINETGSARKSSNQNSKWLGYTIVALVLGCVLFAVKGAYETLNGPMFPSYTVSPILTKAANTDEAINQQLKALGQSIEIKPANNKGAKYTSVVNQKAILTDVDHSLDVRFSTDDTPLFKLHQDKHGAYVVFVYNKDRVADATLLGGLSDIVQQVHADRTKLTPYL